MENGDQAVAALPAADELELPEVLLDELLELAALPEFDDFDPADALESPDDVEVELPASELLAAVDEAAGEVAVEPLRLSVR